MFRSKLLGHLRRYGPTQMSVKVNGEWWVRITLGGIYSHARADIFIGMKIRFLSSNDKKTAEVKDILESKGVEAVAVAHKIEEIQTTDVNALLRDKAIKAYQFIGRPLFVEHTGLYAEALNQFPGGLTQVFWDTLLADRITALFKALGDQRVTAKTHVAYIDGKAIQTFEGSVAGRFPDEPRGPEGFQWDPVFVPDGFDLTFAEMGPKEKNQISMRKLALDAFAAKVLKR